MPAPRPPRALWAPRDPAGSTTWGADCLPVSLLETEVQRAQRGPRCVLTARVSSAGAGRGGPRSRTPVGGRHRPPQARSLRPGLPERDWAAAGETRGAFLWRPFRAPWRGAQGAERLALGTADTSSRGWDLGPGPEPRPTRLAPCGQFPARLWARPARLWLPASCASCTSCARATEGFRKGQDHPGPRLTRLTRGAQPPPFRTSLRYVLPFKRPPCGPLGSALGLRVGKPVPALRAVPEKPPLSWECVRSHVATRL